MRALATLLPFFCLFACIRIPQTTALDAGLPRILVDGYPLHVERVGSAQQPPLIVIHGGPGADMSYLRSLDALSDTYYIIYYDQRGTGLSAREDPSGHSLERFVADLDAVVDAHSGGRPLRMLGHSWGAMLLVAYAARHPQKVSHIVLAEPGMLDPEAAVDFITQLKASQTIGQLLGIVPALIGALAVETEDGYERGDYVMSRMVGSGKGPPYQCEGDVLPEGAFGRAGYASFRSMLGPVLDDPAAFQFRLATGIEDYRGKTLFLSTQCSFIGFDFQEHHHLHYFGSRAEHRLLKGQGHNMFTIRPEAALQEVREFLRR